MVDSSGAGWGHVSSGRVRALAVISRSRSERLPNMPSMMELGLDPREYVARHAFMAPKATPATVIRRVNEAVNQVRKEAPIAARLRKLGAAPR